jgi:hypothetical protein
MARPGNARHSQWPDRAAKRRKSRVEGRVTSVGAPAVAVSKNVIGLGFPLYRLVTQACSPIRSVVLRALRRSKWCPGSQPGPTQSLTIGRLVFCRGAAPTFILLCAVARYYLAEIIPSVPLVSAMRRCSRNCRYAVAAKNALAATTCSPRRTTATWHSRAFGPEQDVKGGRKVVVKLWNIARFCEPHLAYSDGTAATIAQDRWILHRMVVATSAVPLPRPPIATCEWAV